MSEPRRLLSHGATDFERRLLESMRTERPGPALRSRMQQGLGVAGPLLWVSNVKAMLSDVATKTFGSGKLLGAKGAFGPLGMAAASTVAAGGIALAVGLSPAELAPIPRAVSVHRVVSRPAVSERAVAPPVERVAQRPESPRAAGANALREEISLLDGARAALAANDTKRAASLLKQHREGFPDGLLVHEARLLRQRLQRTSSTTKSGPRRPSSTRRTPAIEPP